MSFINFVIFIFGHLPKDNYHTQLLFLSDIFHNSYTRSPLEDSRLFEPSPWKILATTYEKKLFLSNPAPGESLLSGDLAMETRCIAQSMTMITPYHIMLCHCSFGTHLRGATCSSQVSKVILGPIQPKKISYHIISYHIISYHISEVHKSVHRTTGHCDIVLKHRIPLRKEPVPCRHMPLVVQL